MFKTEHEYWLGTGMMAAIKLPSKLWYDQTRQKGHLVTMFRESYLGILKS